MKQNRHLLEELKRLDSAGIEFADAKQALLAKGFKEDEITHTLYQFSYDGKPNPSPDAHVHEHYKKHPHVAERVGDALLKEDKRIESERQRDGLILNLLAGRFAPGRHAQSKHLFIAGNSIHFPVLTFMILSFVWLLVAKLKLDLSDTYVYAGMGILFGLGLLKAKYWS